MTTWLVTHEACLRHDSGVGHPENRQRLEVVLQALGQSEFEALEWRNAPGAEVDQLLRVHDQGYVEEILGLFPLRSSLALDADTMLSPGSLEAALRAAGAVCLAVDAVLDGRARRAFCAIRPPGHHAESDGAMGFCLFNNIAIGASHAVAVHGLQRVAIVDFDVHHGNGTQHSLASRTQYLYLSSHQSPLYPGTGTTASPQHGRVLNVPLPPGAGSTEFRAAYEEILLPALETYDPQLIMISAGFDAHADDPLADLYLNKADYAWVTERLAAIAEHHCAGRIVSALEGGYNLKALAGSVSAHVSALLGKT